MAVSQKVLDEHAKRRSKHAEEREELAESLKQKSQTIALARPMGYYEGQPQEKGETPEGNKPKYYDAQGCEHDKPVSERKELNDE